MLALLLAALSFTDPTSQGTGPLLAQATPPAPPAVEAPRAPRAAPAAKAPPAAPAPPAPPAPLRAMGVLRGDWPDQPSGKDVTIEDQLSIDDALEQIADAAGWDISLNTGRTGNRLLVLKLRNAPVEDALRVVLNGTGLAATRHGRIVTVADDEALPVAPAAPVPTLTGFDKPTGKTFSGDFDATPAPEALRQIAKAGGLSIVLPPDEDQEISASFKDTPVEDALRAVLMQADLVAERQGTLVVVKRGSAGGMPFPFIPPGLPEKARREVERAMREHGRDAERAMRDAERASREAGREASSNGRDREVTNQDLTIPPGDNVRDVNVVKGSLTVGAGAETRNINVVKGSAVLQTGASARDVSVVFGSARLESGATARKVVAIGGDVDVAAGATVEDEAVSIGGRVLVDPDAEVGNTQTVSIPSLPGVVGGVFGLFGGESSPLATLFTGLSLFVLLFLVGLLVVSVFQRRVDAVAATLTNAPLRTTVAGLLAWIALIVLTPIAFLLFFTVLGTPVTFFLVVAVTAALVLGLTTFLQMIGRALPVPEARRTVVVQLALGTLLFTLVTMIPLLGFAVWVVTSVVMLGAVIRSRFGQPPTVLPTTVVPPPVEP
ncbi:MAG: hypothetical protein QM767_12815 [Anaeromyxobacter sp.]